MGVVGINLAPGLVLLRPGSALVLECGNRRDEPGHPPLPVLLCCPSLHTAENLNAEQEGGFCL